MDILDLHQKSIDCVMPLLERHFGTLPEGEAGGGGSKICHNQLYFRKTNLFLVFYRSYIILVVFVLKPSRVIVLYEKIFSVFN